MTTYGLTSAGFVSKPLLVCKSELEELIKGIFGEGADLDPQSNFGQLIGILAERESDWWDGMLAVYSAFDPDLATGQALDSICAITGTIRLRATRSTVDLTFVGDPGTVIPVDFQASVQGTGVRFELYDQNTPPVIGGGRTISATMMAVDTGPLPAPNTYLNVIETPVDGLTSVSNAEDAVLGRNIETDAELRIRRVVELQNPANAVINAIRSHLLNVDGVTGCYVFENTSMVTDGNNVPAKSVNPVVSGVATAANIAASLLATVAGGISTYGVSYGDVIDDEGFTHRMYYDVAANKNIWVAVDVIKDPLNFPVDGEAQIRALVLAAGAAYVIGRDVVSRALVAQVFSIPGVIDATALIGLSNPPTTDTTIPISLYQIARFDSGRLTVTLSDGTP